MVHAVGAWLVCFRKPREKADLVRQRLLSLRSTEEADGNATQVGCDSEIISCNSGGGEQSYELKLLFWRTSAAGSGHAAELKSKY